MNIRFLWPSFATTLCLIKIILEDCFRKTSTLITFLNFLSVNRLVKTTLGFLRSMQFTDTLKGLLNVYQFRDNFLAIYFLACNGELFFMVFPLIESDFVRT